MSGQVERGARIRPRNRKQLIVAAAGARFLRFGYTGTAMTAIAADLDVTSTALYRHFPNKQALLAAVVTEATRSVAAAAEEARGDGVDALLDVLTRQALLRRGHPALWRREARQLDAAGQQGTGRRLLVLRDAVRDELCAARDLGEADAVFLAECVLSLLGSVSYHQVTPPGGRLEALLRELAGRAATAPVPVAVSGAVGVPFAAPQAPEPSADRREQLVREATRLFAARGYADVGIEDVAAAAGIAGPSVYHHFSGKADLLAEIIDRSARAIRRYTDAALGDGSSPADSLRLLLRSYAGFALGHRAGIAVSVTEVIHLPRAESAAYRAVQREGILRWVRLLCAARPGLDEDEARVTVQAVVMLVNDAVRRPPPADPGERAALVDRLAGVGLRVLLPDLASPEVALLQDVLPQET
ncbi:TetR/AcrR family transcriptional regulator [Streptomyces sp. NPDC059009]|uniref:TetR/AcrR family transcriptional regulator n=1 Tax=Streptomyces sp. NPDC059009 TaxID=3346694 RepID=UPI0036AE17F6